MVDDPRRPPMDDPPGAVAALWDRLISIAKTLEPEDWARPTPCAEWNVHDLLAHCAAVQVDLDGSADVAVPEDWDAEGDAAPLDRWAEAGVAARRSWGPEQVRTELRTAREGHVARLQRVEDWSAGVPGPVGLTTEGGLLAIRCYDLWVHLQDLHTALGDHADIGDDSAAARAAHEFVISHVPWLLARRVSPGEDAAVHLVVAAPVPLDKVVTARDGKGRFETGADDVGSVVRAAPEALTLLISGRGHAQTWRHRGLLDWSGPVADAFVQRARFFQDPDRVTAP